VDQPTVVPSRSSADNPVIRIVRRESGPEVTAGDGVVAGIVVGGGDVIDGVGEGAVVGGRREVSYGVNRGYSENEIVPV